MTEAEEVAVDISVTYEFTAPPEVVFNSLNDPDRTTRWLPVGMRAERLDDRAVRVFTRVGTADFEVDTDVDNLQVAWRSLGGQRLQARARVGDSPAGGSHLQLVVSIPEGFADESQARSALDETMRHLQRDVSDNFNAG